MVKIPARTRRTVLANNFYPVILAGGRGTRFWPLSRKRRAKQLLPLNSKKSMIQETVERCLHGAHVESDLRNVMGGCGRKFVIGLEVHDAPAVEIRCLLAEGEVEHAFGYGTVFERK